MSVTRRQFPPCRCGARVEALLADSINVVRHPHFRAELLARTLHVVRCACGLERVVEQPVLYLDFARRQFLGCFPRADLARAGRCSAEVSEAWELALGARAAAPARRVGEQGFLVRVCFGYEELREKVVAHEAGLDDHVLEALKASILDGEQWFRARAVATLRLDRVGPDGALWLRPEWLGAAPPGAERGAVRVARASYQAACVRGPALLGRLAGLAAGPHVSLLRLLALDGDADADGAAAAVAAADDRGISAPGSG